MARGAYETAHPGAPAPRRGPYRWPTAIPPPPMRRALALGLALSALAVPAAAQVRPSWPTPAAPPPARSVVVRARPVPPPPRPSRRPESRVGEAWGMLVGVAVGGGGGYVVGRAATGDPLGGLFCLPAGLGGLVVGGVVGAKVGPVRRPAADTTGAR